MRTGNKTPTELGNFICAFVFSIVYGSTLFYLVFDARRRRSLHERFNLKMLNIRPIYGKVVNLSKFIRLNQRDQIVNFLTDVFGNILMFMPLPVCIFLMLGSVRLRFVVLFGATLSLMIELIQFIFGLGVADIDDVLLNTLGTLLGYKIIQIANGKIAIRFAKNTLRK